MVIVNITKEGIMRVVDLIELLKEQDPNIELVIDVNGKYVTPAIKKSIVHYKHEYSGTTYTDEALVLSE